jgi:hypothetical protein
MALSLLFKKTRAQVGLLRFDASLSENHLRSATLTDFPVEAGADITDHIRVDPESLEINGVISNTPIVYLASLQAESPIEGDLTSVEDRVEAAYKELQRMQDEGELVTVVTSLREYENMALTSLSVTRDVTNGNVLNAQLSLRQVLRAQLETVEAPEPENAARGKGKNLGKQSSKPSTSAVADKAEQNTSVAKGLTGFIGRVFGG